MLESLYDKSSRNNILYNADWTKFYDDNVSISLYDKNSSFINGVSPEDFPDKVPFIKNKIRQIKSDKNIWLVYDYCYEESPEDPIWIQSIASYGHWSRILHSMLWIFAVLFPITVFISAFVGYHILKKRYNQFIRSVIWQKRYLFPSIFQNVLKHQTLMMNFLTCLMHLIL